ncbi:prepilin peptidase [Candidatus Saccharibacteria bacterium]|nr:prepilin peptidase [Candidatus Saccharibacteria bacterium]NIV04339.1 prepilin peptidase [Calditrichia bacterium]NIS38880.1 prepilin peptidase [Candidatus Saccharibacteria bacterium]NIV72864.1 prepilin peptidase [Calditrichia bacterium]NIW00079.1 prepilin peptidase [Candidatus Saccharibacteria bacterium]
MCSGLYYILTVLFGLAVGSFLNAYIWRLKKGNSVWRGRSICPECKHNLSWLDLVPVLSYAVLKGRCRYCGKKISLQYPLVELATAILFVMVLYVHFEAGNGLHFILRDWFFIAVLMIIFVYDLKWGYILDRVSLPSIIIAFSVNILIGFSWHNLLLAAAIGSGFFLLQYAISRGKWIGGGDIRMGALMGFILGWPNVVVGLFLSYIVGSSVAVYLLARKKKKMGSTIAMGTFLAVGTVIAMLWGVDILMWYLQF